MVKARAMDERELRVLWKRLPKSDRQFISALIVISEAIGDEALRYHELPARLGHVLREADRDTLFSLVAESLGLLLDAPAMERVKRARRRNGKGVPAQVKKRGTARTRRKAKRIPSK